MESLIRDFKPKVSEQTIRTYLSSIKMVLQMVDSSNNEILLDSKKIINKMDGVNLNTQKTRLASVIVGLGAMKTSKNNKKTEKAIKEYTARIDEIKLLLNDVVTKNEKTDKQRENWIDDKEFELVKKTLLDNIPSKIHTIIDLMKFRDYIIWILQTEISGRNELYCCKLLMKPKNMQSVYEDTEHNYLLLNKAKKEVLYIRNVSKTSKSSQVKEFKLGLEFYIDLLEYKKHVNKFNKDNWLILGEKGEPITANRFGVLFGDISRKILGKKVGTTLLRHITASRVDIGKLKEDADKAGHSVEMHLQYAKKE